MKKIKLIILLLIIMIASGCTKEYNLIIDNDKIIEEFNITLDNNEENKQRLELDYFPLHADDTTKYEKKIEKVDNLLNAHFSYTYNPKEFVNANSINECFETKEILVDNQDYYYFKLENMKECMSDYNLDINITTNNKVLDNNADEIKDNKYIWHLTDDNKSTFKLEMKIDKNNYSKSSNKSLFYTVVLVVVTVVIIILAIYLIIKRNKSNKI